MSFLKIDLKVTPSRKKTAIIQMIGGHTNTVITIIQGLVLMPLYMDKIGAVLYGFWLATGGLLGILGVVDIGIGALVSQRIARSYSEKRFVDIPLYFFNGFLIYVLISVVLLVIGWLTSLFLPFILDLDEQYSEIVTNCFQLAVIAASINILNNSLRSFSQSLLRPIIPIVSLIFSRLVGLSVLVIMLLNGYGLWSLAIGVLITAVLVFMLNLIQSAQILYSINEKLCISMKKIKELLKLSPMLYMSKLSSSLTKDIEPLLITILLKPELATAYAITKRAASVVFMFISVIRNSMFYGLAHFIGEKDRNQVAKLLEKIIEVVLFSSVISLIVYAILNQKFVELWVGSEFFIGQDVVVVIALGTVVVSLKHVFLDIMNADGEFIKSSIISLSDSVARVGVMFVLLKIMGIQGVPYAVLLSSFVFSVVSLRYFSKHYELKMWISKNFVVMVLMLIVFLVFSYYFSSMNINNESWFGFVIYSSLVFIFVLLAYIVLVPGLLERFFRLIKNKELIK